MAYALDTNCLLRWLLRDIKDQADIVERYLHLEGSKLHVADAAIIEMVWALKKFYKFDDDLVAGFVRKVLEHENISCNRMLFSRVLDDYVKSPKASFVDVCLAHYAGLQDATLVTFDRALAKKLPKLVKLAG